MFLTIFTPTYNRAYIISNLFQSLKRQTCKDFEWLVIDDGSTDNTEALFNELSKESSFTIRYIRQKNGGKHRAINKGVKEAKGSLFFIVDSDDYLLDNAIERIALHSKVISKKTEYAGMSGMRAYPDGSRIGGEVAFDTLDCSAFDYWFKHNVTGDSAEIFKTDVLRKFLFPEIEGERFCPEALIWYRIASAGYIMHYFNEKIYICDYLPDGLTAKITKLRIDSPISAMLTYKELYNANVNRKWTSKAGINYWRFNFHCPKYKRLDWKPSLVFFLPGFIMYLKDKLKRSDSVS